MNSSQEPNPITTINVNSAQTNVRRPPIDQSILSIQSINALGAALIESNRVAMLLLSQVSTDCNNLRTPRYKFTDKLFRFGAYWYRSIGLEL